MLPLLAVASALVAAGAGAGAGAVALAAAGAFAVASEGAVAVAVATLTRRGRPALALVLLYAGLAGLLALALLAGSRLGWPDEARGVWLFLGVLPLVNAVFDFVSYGLTFALVRCGLRWKGAWPVLFGLADLAVAAILFTGLGAALVTVAAGANALAGTEVFPLHPLFDGLRGVPGAETGPQDYWWLYAMVFSTLLPTLAHLTLAAASLTAVVAPLRPTLRRMVESRDSSQRDEMAAAFALGTLWFAAVALAMAAVAAIPLTLLAFAPMAGQTYLQLFEQIAVWLGQIAAPGPDPLDPGQWG